MKMKKLSLDRIDWITYGKNTDWGQNECWEKTAITIEEHKNPANT